MSKMNNPARNEAIKRSLYAKQIEQIKNLEEGAHKLVHGGGGLHTVDCPGCRARRIKNQVMAELGAKDSELLDMP